MVAFWVAIGRNPPHLQNKKWGCNCRSVSLRQPQPQFSVFSCSHSVPEFDPYIDVPMDATVGDVIVGLINEGFLDADTPSATTVLYNKDADGGISSGVKYDDRSKTVKEYGWQKGQTLVAVSEGVAG